MNKHLFYRVLLLFIFFASCRSINLEKCTSLHLADCIQQRSNETSVPLKKRPWITIWVHGTRAFFSKFFFRNFFYCLPGLNPAANFEQKYHLRSVAELLSAQAPELFSFDTFYFFGWSGKLKHKARIKAARELYQAVQDLIAHYEEQHHQKPRIRIITHSHGGNVALNMAKIKNCCTDACIDELILLACPVQEQTAHYAHDGLFKKIYSLYSLTDSIQVLDPQGFHYWRKKHKRLKPPTFFSGRCFPDQCLKVRQAALKLDGRNLMHIDFLFHKFLKFLPYVLCHMKDWHKKSSHECPKLFLLKTKQNSNR